MRFMNDVEIDIAAQRYAEHPLLGPATKTLVNLRDWADSNSDGWAYWPKPARAAAKLMELVERDGTSKYVHDRERADVTKAELTRALAPVKAFRTKQVGAGVRGFEIVEPPKSTVLCRICRVNRVPAGTHACSVCD